MTITPEDRRRLLEVAYDLAPEKEASELEHRLEGDAELAAAAKEADQTAALFQEAARVEAPPVNLVRPASLRVVAPSSADPPRPKSPARASSSRRAWARWANWLVGISALGLLLIALGSYWFHRGHLANLAAEHLHLRVVGPGRWLPGVTHPYSVTTTSLAGEPVEAQVELILAAPDGHSLMAHKEKTDAKGQLALAIPGNVDVPRGTSLEVTATCGAAVQQATIPLDVETTRHVLALSLDQPAHRAGERVRFRALLLSRFGLAADQEVEVRFRLADPQEKTLPGSVHAVKTAQGVASGEFLLPESSAAGPYALVAQSDLTPPARCEFSVCEKGKSSPKAKASGPARAEEPVAQPSGLLADKLQVQFHPEGGELVAGLENRVYFTVRDAQGKPVRLAGRVIDSQGRVAAPPVETAGDGMGSFALTPLSGQSYRLKIETPADIKAMARLPEVVGGSGVVLTAGMGVFPADKPLEFNLRAQEAGIPLVVAAWCRGAPVGIEALVTDLKSNAVTISLDKSVAGVIRLVVYDYRTSPPRPIAQRLVYRQVERRLHIQLDGPCRQEASGKPCELSLRVTDEAGAPVKAVLGVSVLDGVSPRAAAVGNPSIETAVLLGSEFQNLEGTLPPESWLSGDSKVSVALDLLLGNQDVRRVPGRSTVDAGQGPVFDASVAPPAVFDNLNELQSRYQESLSSYRAGRTRVLNVLVTATICGSIGLVLFLTMLSLLNVPCGLLVWIPSVAVVVVCWFTGNRLLNPPTAPSVQGEVAFISSVPPAGKGTPAPSAEPAKSAPESESTRSRGSGAASVRPATESASCKAIFWGPSLRCDAQGRAHVRFPAEGSAGPFRVLVDAQAGDGRLGSGRFEVSLPAPSHR